MRTILILVALLLVVPVASAATDVIPYQSHNWRYQEVGWGGNPGFEATNFNDAGFSLGGGGFANVNNYCGYLPAATNWDLNTDMLMRQAVDLTPGTTNVHVAVAIDNDLTIYWNGVALTSAYTDNCAYLDRVVVSVPQNLVGTHNVVAIRAHDRGGLSYVDARVSADLAPPQPLPELGSLFLVGAAVVVVGAVAWRRRS